MREPVRDAGRLEHILEAIKKDLPTLKAQVESYLQ